MKKFLLSIATVLLFGFCFCLFACAEDVQPSEDIVIGEDSTETTEEVTEKTTETTGENVSTKVVMPMKVERKCKIVEKTRMGDAVYMNLEAGDMVRTSFKGPGQFVHIKCGDAQMLSVEAKPFVDFVLEKLRNKEDEVLWRYDEAWSLDNWLKWRDRYEEIVH